MSSHNKLAPTRYHETLCLRNIILLYYTSKVQQQVANLFLKNSIPGLSQNLRTMEVIYKQKKKGTEAS